jgi:hypothetical protein
LINSKRREDRGWGETVIHKIATPATPVYPADLKGEGTFIIPHHDMAAVPVISDGRDPPFFLLAGNPMAVILALFFSTLHR